MANGWKGKHVSSQRPNRLKFLVLLNEDADSCEFPTLETEHGAGVAFFTERSIAERFAQKCAEEKGEHYEIHCLDFIKFRTWLCEAHRAGIKVLALNPNEGRYKATMLDQYLARTRDLN